MRAFCPNYRPFMFIAKNVTLSNVRFQKRIWPRKMSYLIIDDGDDDDEDDDEDEDDDFIDVKT